jgi:hypothetical protein
MRMRSESILTVGTEDTEAAYAELAAMSADSACSVAGDNEGDAASVNNLNMSGRGPRESLESADSAYYPGDAGASSSFSSTANASSSTKGRNRSSSSASLSAGVESTKRMSFSDVLAPQFKEITPITVRRCPYLSAEYAS